MLSDWKFWLLTLLGAAVLALSLLNHNLRNKIAEKQQAVLERQQFINDSQSLSKFNSQFIRALANLAVQTGDANIAKLLADHGITYQVNPSPGTAATPPAGRQPTKQPPEIK